MVIFVDIDGTVCPEGGGTPFEGAVDTTKEWAAEGHVIVFWTARPWGDYLTTKKWLTDCGFVFNELIMGKPIANLVVDDRTVSNLADAKIAVERKKSCD